MSKKGISMVTLIITIIIIIILAAIVIFAGLSTIKSANFARFTYEFSNFEDAIANHYNSIKQNIFLDTETRSDEQIYYEIATKIDVGIDGEVVASGLVEELGLELFPEYLNGTEYYEITDDKNVLKWGDTKSYYTPTEKHYITNKGEAFVLPRI